ncbi:hypothetical protein C2S51_026635 [Perilla frutescens var. frutescens]|nr:hypothetical protein C2S51_026635 [Perilla frutescens var. frutescens]
MAIIPCFLFLSLLSHSILLTKCDVDDDDLLRGINQYRASLNLTALNMAEGADCLADEIADSYNNQICTNTTPPNNATLPKFSDYPGVLTKCGPSATNTTGGGQILPACIHGQQQSLVLSTFTTNYASYLNSTQFSDIGIGSEDDWIVVVLTNTTGGGSNGFPVDDDDDLLRGINQYRASLNLSALNMARGADCLADEIADSYNNRICTNTTPPNNTTLPKFSDYPGVLTKCGLSATNTTGEGQILPACIPGQQQSLVLSTFTTNYASYLNSTQFSDIGIGSEDDWIVIVLTNTTGGGSNTTGGGSNTAGGGNNTTGGGSSTTGGGSNTTGDGSNRASSLAAMSPVVFSIICLFMLI